MPETMDTFEKLFVSMEVEAEFLENAKAIPLHCQQLDEVDDYGLEVLVGLPQLASHAIFTKTEEKIEEDDYFTRLVELKAT